MSSWAAGTVTVGQCIGFLTVFWHANQQLKAGSILRWRTVAAVGAGLVLFFLGTP